MGPEWPTRTARVCEAVESTPGLSLVSFPEPYRSPAASLAAAVGRSRISRCWQPASTRAGDPPDGALASRAPPGVNRSGPSDRRAVLPPPEPVSSPGRPTWKKERVTQVHTPPEKKAVRRRIGAVTAAVFTAGLLYAVTGSAAAAPTPTLSQAQHKLSQLESSLEQLDQQYDAVQLATHLHQSAACSGQPAAEPVHGPVRRRALPDFQDRGHRLRGRERHLLADAADLG